MFDNLHKNHHAYDIPQRAINLPSYHDICLEEQKQVIDTVKKSEKKGCHWLSARFAKL